MELDTFLEFISNSIQEIGTDVEKLYSNRSNNKSKTLDHLNSEVMMMDNYIKYIRNTNQLRVGGNPHQCQDVFAPEVQPVVNGTRDFTLEQLTQYNGKNGNPAYVAVNGVVYDVTNNAAWAAATHSGLSAGNDLTNEFTSCHAESNILDMLPVVGNLI